MMDLGSNFLATVRRSPDAAAFVSDQERWTYAAWSEQVLSLVAGLAREGIKRSDRLICILQNGPELASVYWACQIAGVALVPLNWRSSARDLGYLVCDSEAAAVICNVSETPASEVLVGADGVLRFDTSPTPADGWMRFASLLHAIPAPAESLAQPDDISILLYTSGTTGRPKGVARTHRAERAAALGHIAQNGYRRGESVLGVMPIYHTMGVKALIMAAMLDGKYTSMPRFDAGRAIDLIEQERVTSLSLVPTLYHDMLKAPGFSNARVASVRVLTFAGAPMTPTLAEQLQAAFRPELFVNQLGSTEIYTFSFNQDAGRTPASVGRAGLSADIRLVRIGAKTPDELVALGEEGEIAVSMSSDDAFSGYWKRPEVDEVKIREGWFFTGDAGRLTAEGDIVLTGRVDDLIISGGENVSPVEVEACLCACPGVSEAVVVGLPHPRWGQIVAAAIIRTRDVSAEEIEAHCRSFGLMPHQRPRWIVFPDEIPKSPAGKVLRRVLIETYAPAMPKE
jgi:2-furoate---CoA ligase